jgi:hypothetical protein
MEPEVEEAAPSVSASQTELMAAMHANSLVTVTMVTKALRKFKSLTKGRPKLKHLNMAKKRKKQERHFARQFEGKVIRDGKHELYILTAGMMHGMRVTLGAVSRRLVKSSAITLEDFSEVLKINFTPRGNSSGPCKSLSPPPLGPTPTRVPPHVHPHAVHHHHHHHLRPYPTAQPAAHFQVQELCTDGIPETAGVFWAFLDGLHYVHMRRL